jgi:nitroreductase
MEFQDVVRRRRMIRAYEEGRPVPAEIRDRLLANALHAPSAGFSQGWGFLVLEQDADRDRFWTLLTDPDEEPDGWLTGMRAAPLLIVALSNKSAYLARYAETDKGWTDQDEARWPVPYWDIDTGMASLLILQTAVDAGLGACFFGVPPEKTDAFRTGFGVPPEYTPVGVISVGYRATDRPSPSLKRGRRPVADVTHFGRW